MKLLSRASVSIALFVVLQFTFAVELVLAKAHLSREAVANSLAPFAKGNEFPNILEISSDQKISIEYTLDIDLHEHIASVSYTHLTLPTIYSV